MKTPFSPFGGKLIILSGDFRQILPVVRHGRRPQIGEACLTSSPLWNLAETITLTTNMRIISCQISHSLEKATRLQSWLLNLGNGTLPQVPSLGNYVIQLPPEICVLSKEDQIRHVYRGLEQSENYTNPSWFANRGILAGKNSIINTVNNEVMTTLPGEACICESLDSIHKTGLQALYPT